MKYEITDLPFAVNALEPHISAETVETHYGKHHQGYVDKLNDTKYGKDDSSVTLEELIKTESGGVFNLAAQIWNHSFYWDCLAPNGGGSPSGELSKALADQFGSFDEMKKELTQAANTQFGSGWAWLALDANKKIKVLSTSNAENPMQNQMTPIYTLDVWEHAYYLDYKNRRPEHVQHVIDHLINWKFVEEQYLQAIK